MKYPTCGQYSFQTAPQSNLARTWGFAYKCSIEFDLVSTYEILSLLNKL